MAPGAIASKQAKANPMGANHTVREIHHSAELEDHLGRLAEMTRPELVARWRTLYRGNPPKGISRSLMLGAIAYKMQVKRSGGISLAVMRRLKRIAEAPDNPLPTKIRSRSHLASGTRLIREWNGTTHIVEAVEGGFMWKGTRHRSLSAVAQAITGARWSGPRFFAVSTGSGP